MKFKILVSLLIGLSLFACKNEKPAEGVKEIHGSSNADLIRNPNSADTPLDTSQLAKITFEEKDYDFGAVKEGTVVEHKFKFTNTGKVPLVIQNARSTCGCTVPEWPEEPIPPGGTGEINAKFNTDTKLHAQRKIITVTANTMPSETKVALFGNVMPKDE